MTAEWGKFVVVEGNDGVGKSTLIDSLAAVLAARGIEVVVTREPGGMPETEIYRQLALSPDIKDDGISQLLLFCIDRRVHNRLMIIPAVGVGKLVLCDRYSGSTFVYQHYGLGVPFEDVKYADRMARTNINGVREVKPDLIILLDARPEVTMARKSGQEETHFDKDGLEKQRRRREAYLILAKRDRRCGCRIINAEQEKDEVFRDVIKILDEEGILSR